jgi:hypothetical protein
MERHKPDSEVRAATLILQDYQTQGAVRPLSTGEGVRHLVPWFIISKEEGSKTKHRLISDCRELNQFFTPQKFRLDNIQAIFPYLQKGWWAAKLDLKDAYFHLPLAAGLKNI